MSPPHSAPSDRLDKFMLRLPDGMRDRLAAAARANGRSLNSEIVARLGCSLENGDPLPAIYAHLETLARRYDTLEAMLAHLVARDGGG